jgi:hypothetical protein
VREEIHDIVLSLFNMKHLKAGGSIPVNTDPIWFVKRERYSED